MRLLILIHRYLGIGIGWLMLLWCLSGIVMIYSPYHRVDGKARVGSLNPVDWSGVGALAQALPAEGPPVSRFQLEMLAGKPVLRLW